MFRKRSRSSEAPGDSGMPLAAAGEPGDRSESTSHGLRELVAERLDAACRALAREIVRSFEPEIIVGLVKGGAYAGEELAAILGCKFVPLRLHARSRDHGYRSPAAESQMPAEVAGKRVLVVDDIPGTGETLNAAVEAANRAGAEAVRTATLVARSSGYRPDFSAIQTDDLVVFPWDYEPTTGAVGSAGDDLAD